MHSRKKVPKDENKEKERLQKATKFSGALTKILQMKKNGVKDKSLLSGIADLLYASPDFYSLWNYRREIFIAMKQELDSSVLDGDTENGVDSVTKSEEFDKLCANELHFIENCLKVNYKSYGTWHHRCWLLTFMNNPDLKREIQLCDQFLKLDGRNFHCWNYRRFVAKLAKIDTTEELNFTHDKINDDSFSNFSSWFYRSSLLKQLYVDTENDQLIQPYIEEDYKQMLNAVYTDPTDQSAWLYLRWLFTIYSNGLKSLVPHPNSQSLAQIKRFLWSSSSDANQFFVAVELSNYSCEVPNISLSINGQTVELSAWNATNGFIWFTRAKFDTPFEDNVQYTFGLGINSGSFQNSTLKAIFDYIKEDNSNFVCFNYSTVSHEDSALNVDSEKYQAVRDLLEIEPDSKWVNYALAWLETDVDFMNNIIEKLIQLDTLRTNYYKDLRSKISLRSFFSKQPSLNRNLHLSLSDLKLHSLRNANQLMHLQYLDLSRNELIKLGTTFSPLVSLRCLLLDCNSIYMMDDKLHLPNLTILSLAHNRISKWHFIEIVLSNFTGLKHLILVDNPILVENRLDRDLLQSKVGSRDLKIYLDQTNECEADKSSIIGAELEATQKRHASEVTHTRE